MSVNKIFKIVLIASIMMLAIGLGSTVTNTARALPLDQTGATIPYSGSLTDESGKPVADGAYGLSFALYQTESGGEVVWKEVVEGVTVQDGSFSVLLGGVNPLPKVALDGDALWLEIGVRGPGEAEYTMLAPRQELSKASPGAPSSPSTASACAHDHWNEYWSGAGVGLTLVSSNDTALWGTSYGGWAGVDGRNNTGNGLYGESSTGTGVYGKTTSTSTTGNATGVLGQVSSSASYPYYARGVVGWATKTTGLNFGGFFQSDSSGGHGLKAVANNSGCSAGYLGTCSGAIGESNKGNGVSGWADTGIALYGYSNSGPVLRVEGSSGNLIEAYHGFVGSDLRFKVTNAGNVTADGTINGGGADMAEMLPAAKGLEPGDVLIIGEDGQLALSNASYQNTVVGVYSTKPGFVGGGGDDENLTGKIPLAVIGVVPVKASAENGAIHPGDLLVASSTPGHAMKAGSNSAVGTVIGKALGTLESGTGVIKMLVMLQ